MNRNREARQGRLRQPPHEDDDHWTHEPQFEKNQSNFVSRFPRARGQPIVARVSHESGDP
jgi:hypothetical protein